jgi:hypothetical protein
VAACTPISLAGIGCGTSSQSNPSDAAGTAPNDASAETTTRDATAESSGDASADVNTGTPDVADHWLADVAESSVADGGDAASPWPDCPPFLQYHMNYVIPAEFAPDGAIVPAPDGSVCATYPWFYNQTVDQCLLSNGGPATDVDGASVGELPPCGWCQGGGVALGGSRTGNSRYSICMDLYACVLQTRCFLGPDGVTSCLCGTEPNGMCASDPNPPGPCAKQEMDSLEFNLGSATETAKAVGHITDTSGLSGCGGNLNQRLLDLVQNNCCMQPGANNCLPSDGGSD